ncbi:hypothetical protein AB4Y40_20715 [Paraburkholderia sp. EG287B]|uniref:hypothetical protein n=1 Tax=Paraburkholderia sp. EG287B TaxID=3237010 RepID=UPI0034D1B1F8
MAALVALAHAQPGFPGHGGGGGFARAPSMPTMPTMHSMPAPRGGGGGMAWGGGYHGGPERGRGPAAYRGAASPMRVADQGGRYERGGNRAPNQWQGQVQQQAPHRDYSYGTPFGGYGGYRGGNPITPVSAESRPVPHPPADSPVRAGSIREDVARYNEERGGSYRQYPRNGGEVPRPPMPSPYRN